MFMSVIHQMEVLIHELPDVSKKRSWPWIETLIRKKGQVERESFYVAMERTFVIIGGTFNNWISK